MSGNCLTFIQFGRIKLLLLTFAAALLFSPAVAHRAEARTPLAELYGETIYVEDVEGALAFRIYQLEVDKYSLLKSEAERRIESRLLSAAAAQRGVSVAALLAEAEGGADSVSPEAIDAYLDENPSRSEADPAKVRERVRNYLGERGRLERRIAFMDSLRKTAGAKILLESPERPRTNFEIASSPTRGPADAPVQIIHFASFGSRNSARSADKIARLVEAFPGKIRQTHINLLTDRDEAVLFAARVGFAAQEADRFWPLHDALFEAEGRLSPDKIKSIASKMGLSASVARDAARSADRLGQAKRDIDRAVTAGIPREPGLFINGLFVSGLLPFDEIKALVEEELARLDPAPN